MTTRPSDYQTNPRVALVIGSGGLKCAAALGVWQVLREMGFEIDMAVGCSGGSLYATAIALDYDQEKAAALTRQLWTAELAQQRHAPSLRQAILPRLFGFRAGQFGLIDDRLIMAQLEGVLGDMTFAETKRPLFLAATDLHTGEVVTIGSGRLVDGIRASIAIPILFAPWQVNGRALIDGGVTNPMPVDVAIREGADLIVAVGFENPLQTAVSSFGQFVNQLTTVQMTNLQKANFAFHHAAHHATILPVIVHFDEEIGLTDTDKLPQIIAAGAKAAREQLQQRMKKETDKQSAFNPFISKSAVVSPKNNGVVKMSTQIIRPGELALDLMEMETAVSDVSDTAVSLTLHKTGQPEQTLAITGDDFLVGRSADADLALPDLPFVSGQHFAIRRLPQGFVVVDLASSNGTRLNNRGLAANVPTPIHNGDIVRIGEERFGVSVGFTFHNLAEAHAPVAGFGAGVSTTQLLQVQRLTIGRAPDCDIVLDSPTIARVHAVVERFGEGEHVIRVESGVEAIWVNDAPIQRARLQPGDAVQIGPHLFTFDGETLTQFDSQGFRLDVVGVHKEVKTKNGPLRILDDVSLTVLPREFVALVGGSGAGKSTLLDALNGFRPAEGQVLVNGRDLYANYDNFRQQIGYVPQYDILPTNLKVEQALHYAAKLRLPADVSREEREERISQALATVDMNSERIRSTRIDRLSGGQRKRVSIAAELIADPKIFFLDEPSSGLDPGLEKKLMYTLRQMADEGRTIILITHATGNIVQADHVGLLSQGRLVFFGPPQEAQEFFLVDDFADIYEKIEHNGGEWRQVFTGSKPQAYQTYVLGRQKDRAGLPASAAARPRFTPGRFLRQFVTLSQRMFRLTLSDPIAFFVALLVMPLVGVLQGAASETYEFAGDPAIIGNAAQVAQTLTANYLPAVSSQIFGFGMSILAFLVGAFGGSQELLKERPIYRRERMVNLKLLPYLGSKFFVFGLFALAQVAAYLFIVSLQVELPADGVLFKGFLEMLITLWLTVMVGVATGLFISAVSPNSTTAVYLVLVVVFFQYIFGGAIHNLRGKPLEFQSYIAATRWATLAMGTTADVLNLAEATIVCGNEFELDTSNLAIDPATGTLNPDSLALRQTDQPACTNRAVDPDDLFLPYGDSASDLLRFWGWQAVLGIVFTLGTLVLVKRLDRV
jgi:ABC-type multidrug transport system ATPase subunit/predicted acylesterase/phospholipase RssA/pSer/pThr/pTyr-binding forkhead associated (FHA) protein